MNTALFIIELIAACTVGILCFVLLFSGASSKGPDAPKPRRTSFNGMPIPRRHH